MQYVKYYVKVETYKRERLPRTLMVCGSLALNCGSGLVGRYGDYWGTAIRKYPIVPVFGVIVTPMEPVGPA